MTTIQDNIPKLRFNEFAAPWEGERLGKIADFSKGKGISKSDVVENGYTECVRYGELYTHYAEVITEIKSRTNLKSSSLVFSESNDVLIPASGESAIDIATATCVLKSGVALSGDLNIIKSRLNGVYLAYYLNNKRKLDIARLSQGISVVHLYSSQLKLLKINVPSLPEQQRIVDFLISVDARISQLTKKKSLLEKYKKGIMQKIFKQEIRFKDDNGNDFPDWQEKMLGEYISAYNKKSTVKDEYLVYTSSNRGLMLQSDYYGEGRITERNNVGFNIIPPDYITYRSRSDNRRFTFNENTLGVTGIISSYYPVFKVINGSNKFFLELCNYFHNHLGKYSVGTSQVVLSFNELSKIKFLMPYAVEQQKIADFLTALDKKIDLANTELKKVQEFKKGLLQQMFV